MLVTSSLAAQANSTLASYLQQGWNILGHDHAGAAYAVGPLDPDLPAGGLQLGRFPAQDHSARFARAGIGTVTLEHAIVAFQAVAS